MKRLGENVFQFKYSSKYITLTCGIIIIVSFLIFALVIITEEDIIPLTLLIAIIFYTYLLITQVRYCNKGVILDNDRGIITLHKWSFNIMKNNFEEVQISEIMGTQRDVDVTTTTKYTSGNWNTSESRSYNIVLQGKFGSKRFQLAYRDDWNLFMTLLYGEQ